MPTHLCCYRGNVPCLPMSPLYPRLFAAAHDSWVSAPAAMCQGRWDKSGCKWKCKHQPHPSGRSCAIMRRRAHTTLIVATRSPHSSSSPYSTFAIHPLSVGWLQLPRNPHTRFCATNYRLAGLCEYTRIWAVATMSPASGRLIASSRILSDTPIIPSPHPPNLQRPTNTCVN